MAMEVLDSHVRSFLQTRVGILAVFFIAFACAGGIAVENMIAPIDFDPMTWQESPGQRSRMVDDLLGSSRLVGMSRSEVEQLLGPPEDVEQLESPARVHLFYWVDYAGIDDLWLEVRLDEDRVETVIRRPD